MVFESFSILFSAFVKLAFSKANGSIMPSLSRFANNEEDVSIEPELFT
jgi:hypothetical protein